MIYINGNGLLYLDGKYLTDQFTEKGIRCHLNRNLKDVENDCVLSLIDLSEFGDSKVSLKCGADIGLSDAFKLIIFAVTSPSNEKLNNELIGFKANIFKKEDIHLFMQNDKVLDKIKRSVEEIISKMGKIDDRIMWRGYISKDLNELVAKMIADRKNKERIASIAKKAADT